VRGRGERVGLKPSFALLAALALAAGCAKPPPLPKAVLEAESRWGKKVELEVEVLSEPERLGEVLRGRAFGEGLPGLLVVYPAPSREPVSIRGARTSASFALLDEGGRAFLIMQLSGCRDTDCVSYYPGRPYRAVLFADQAWFIRNGVAEGSRFLRREGPKGIGGKGR